MGTISDKLMRIISTKEDIRQALISKGYDVPTSIPFKEYAKMILDLPCKADSFPDIEGIVARYSASGLTNEQMAANPVWVDKTGNGYDLQMKNFVWKEGSGISDIYPGFILSDGVDDFAVTEKELNFEDTYTVYTAFIPFQVDPVRAMGICGKDFKKGFYFYNSNTHLVYYTSGLNNYIPVRINQFHIIVCKRNKTNAVIKNLITGESKTFSVSELIDNPGVYYLWRHQGSGTSTGKTAIAGQTICNGYFSTDEDDEKVFDWYKKQYPWLFFDQAWTVTGKTNEDEDRATIANITGNGNNLVLSNFGFAEGSGYGLYKTPFELYPSVQHSSKYSLSFSKFALGDHNLIIAPKQNDLSYDIKVKVTGLKDGVKFKWGWIGTTGYIDITTDGIHMLNKPASQIRQLIVEFAEDFDPDHVVTIEQIPEYEGYLVTDGVDDIASSNTVVYEADFTFIGEWKFIQKDDTVAGINSLSHLYIQNRYNRGATVMINSIFENKKNITDYMTFKAITSKGKGYDENWNEVDLLYGDGNKGTSGVNIGGQGGTEFCHMIFKNMALYMNKVFTKDECIKAYNYLQTLKSK